MKFCSVPLLILAAFLGICASVVCASRAKVLAGGYVAEIRIASSSDGFIQLFPDTGAGLSEYTSIYLPIIKSEKPLIYKFPLKPGSYHMFRLDPIDREATISISSCRILTAAGETVRAVPFTQFKPVYDIASAVDNGARFDIVVQRERNDPQLTVSFAPPLDLSPVWSSYGVDGVVCGVSVFLVLASLLYAFDRNSPRIVLLRVLVFCKKPPVAAVMVACACILSLRRPDVVHNPQFFGEESVIFYRGAYAGGGIAALIDPYAGYLHLVPRLVAALSMALHPVWAPALFVSVAFVLTLYVAARTLSVRCPLPRHPGCALAIVLVPDAQEVLGNIVNIQWILAGGLALLLVSSDPKRWWQILHDAVAALLLGLTGPFSIVAAPLFLWRALQRKTVPSFLIAALAVSAGAVQLWLVLRTNTVPIVPTEVSAPSSSLDLRAMTAVPGMRIGASMLAGVFVSDSYPRFLELGLTFLTLLGVAALAFRRSPTRTEFVWLLGIFLGLLAVSLYRCRLVLPALCHPIYGARYFFPLQLIVIWLLFAAASDQRRWMARTAAAVLVWSLAANIPRLREIPFPDMHWRELASEIQPGEAIKIPVVPPPWILELPKKGQKQ